MPAGVCPKLPADLRIQIPSRIGRDVAGFRLPIAIVDSSFRRFNIPGSEPYWIALSRFAVFMACFSSQLRM